VTNVAKEVAVKFQPKTSRHHL